MRAILSPWSSFGVSGVKAVTPILAVALLASLLASGVSTRGAAEEARAIAAPAVDETPSGGSAPEVAVLAGGCFWGVQGVFQHVEGVLNAVSGYAGGAAATAHYEEVGEGDTGHAESVRITYDPSKITYGKLLQVFFAVAHDPTQLNRQGPDYGSQYRSTIFPQNAEQRAIAEGYIRQLGASGAFESPIVTTLEAGKTFYSAESYHQDFLVRNPGYPYIVINDLPKVRALARMFPEIYREEPVLVLKSRMSAR
jgi:peptide-methionine (S)-S-oxide reductase